MSAFSMRIECDGCDETGDFEAPGEWYAANFWMQEHDCDSDLHGTTA